jgi:hypothetical protein
MGFMASKVSFGLLNVNPLYPSGHYMYRQFNIHKSYIQPAHCIYVFSLDLRSNNDYFPVKHYMIDFYNREEVCLLCGTDRVLTGFSAVCNVLVISAAELC